MSFIAWIVLGLVAGFIASQLVDKQGHGIGPDILLGVVGAVVGGYLFQRLGAQGVTGLNAWSVLVAASGSAIVLILYHAIRGSRP